MKTAGSVGLRWQAVPGASGYTISISRESAENWHDIGSSPGTAFEVAELPEGTQYFFRIASTAGVLQSGWSQPVMQYSSLRGDLRPLLVPPEALRSALPADLSKDAEQGPLGLLGMQWGPVSGAMSYVVQICEADACRNLNKSGDSYGALTWNEYFRNLAVVTDTRYLAAGLQSRRTYGFRVAGLDAKGQLGRYSLVLMGVAP